MRMELPVSGYSPDVQPNPDPKPGRWILPVVILAMMGFAWLFINAAEDPTVSPPDPTSSAGGTTTTTVTPGTTTTTVAQLPDDVLAYNAAIVDAGIAMAGLQQEMVQANEDWDARTVGYSESLASMQAIDAQITTWRNGLDGITVPTSFSEYANFHAIMTAAASEVVRTSGEIVTGLQAPDSGEARRSALASFNEAVTAYGDQVNVIAAYTPGDS